MHKLRLQFLFILAVLLLSSISYAKTLVVKPAFNALGAALKKAGSGDIIEVWSGEYREDIKIDKTIRLIGLNKPVIVGVKEKYIIEITGHNSVIEGITVKKLGTAKDIETSGIYISKSAYGTVIKNNHIYDVMHGIWSAGAKDITVKDNIISGKKNLDRNYRGNCISLSDSENAYITGNKLSYCRDGIYIERYHGGEIAENYIRDSRYGIHAMWANKTMFSRNTVLANLAGLAIMYSKNAEIKGNILYKNQTNGLFLVQTVESSITDNTLTGNNKGVLLYNSMFNNLTNNLIMDNGIGLNSWGGSEENTVNGNSFIGNETQVKIITSKDQIWNQNYWSDYLGWDMNGDGIGDQPYESGGMVDRILWKYPAARLLYSSPAIHLLWLLEKQFPLLKSYQMTDNKPYMQPLHKNWKELRQKYPSPTDKPSKETEDTSVRH